MKWLLILLLFQAPAFAGEDCASQLRGKCTEVCVPGEVAQQGAFLDCTESQQCCVPKETPKTPAISSFVVLIDQLAFSPEVIRIRTGTEVIWKNKDDVDHTVTADDGGFNSNTISAGAEFKMKFNKSGTYPYTCEMHPFMSGKVVVE